MKVIVLGGGVVGVTTAYFLAKSGHQVVLLEKNPASAMGCSNANGGQLSYSHIEPWASKSSLKALFRTILCTSLVNLITQFTNREFLKWSWSFLKNCRHKKSQENAKKLYQLGSYSKKALEYIIAEEKDALKFNYKQGGILHFYRNSKAFEKAIIEAQDQASFGFKAQILTKDECIKKEPTLVKLYDENKLAGGIFYENDASGDAFLFTKSLEKICKEKYGVVFEYNAEVKNIFTNYQKITGIHTSKGVFTADKYVCCLGAYGNSLLKGVGIDTKIYPLKGYSFSIATDGEFIAPKIALTDPENKVVYSRLGDVFRAAGGVEICGIKNNKSHKHLRFLERVIKSSFSDFGNFNKAVQWFGFRPFRSNSIPLICEAAKYQNLLLNMGHGSLGFTLSAASAAIIAGLVVGKKDESFAFLAEEEVGIYRR